MRVSLVSVLLYVMYVYKVLGSMHRPIKCNLFSTYLYYVPTSF